MRAELLWDCRCRLGEGTVWNPADDSLYFVDVLGREFYRSVPGALELSEMLMVVVLFCALPMVSWRAEHVCFELADLIYKGRAERISKVVMDLICAVAFGGVGWACLGYAQRTLEDGEVSANLRVPVGYFVYLMAVMLLLAAFMHVLRCGLGRPDSSPQTFDE